jgi:superfamily II DNA or RNA helicase
MERALTAALTAAPLAEVRALIAQEWLGASETRERAGAITLRPHQREAVARLRAVIEEFGGALLADDVGLGKTYVAAALIGEAPRALVVAPASLRDMWRRALAASGAGAEFASYTALSRGRVPAGPFTLVVLDEAHHARTPGASRYAALARLTAGARVLALTATPVHNSRDDLAAILALFLGARAWAMDDAALARCVVRRTHADLAPGALPALEPPGWIATGDDERVLHEIVALPPPVPPSDGGDGGALVAWGLARQWASSRAALQGALRRRLARAAALGAALEEGRYPSGKELTAWAAADDVIQLAFPSLVSGEHAGTAPLLAALRLHEAALRALARRAREDPSVDVARAAQLRGIQRAHTGERVVAFTQFADTALAYYRELAPTGRVAALTARGARVAGGLLSRREALARFAPRALGLPAPRAADRIDLLVTTDLLSEGLDLGDASVVVHLDLPWTPARLEQRVGRSRRLGAPHARTSVYAFAPPAASERLLEVERRLHEKLRAAGRVTGIAGAILPSLGPPADAGPAAARTQQQLHDAIGVWRSASVPLVRAPAVAAGTGGARALIVLARDGAAPVLAAALDGSELSEDPAVVLAAAVVVGAARDAPADAAAIQRALQTAARWLEHRSAARAVGGTAIFRAASRRSALRRIAGIARRAPHHRRALIAPLAARARRVVTTPFGVGAEHILEMLAGAPLADEAWLRALTEFGAIHAADDGAAPCDAAAIAAMIIVDVQ